MGEDVSMTARAAKAGSAASHPERNLKGILHLLWKMFIQMYFFPKALYRMDRRY